MTRHPIPESRRSALASVGLDPDAVADVIARTIAEDLAGGEDVTTNATVPADQRSHATFGVRAMTSATASGSRPADASAPRRDSGIGCCVTGAPRDRESRPRTR
ncbi:MAG: hypothetical protein ACKOQ7_10620, partial [Actinomycetota bacterium]